MITLRLLNSLLRLCFVFAYLVLLCFLLLLVEYVFAFGLI